MARTYISVNLSEDQLEFIKLINDRGLELFSIDDVEEKIKRKFGNLNAVLENLVDKEILSRIEKGKYCRAAFRDELVIGTSIARDGAVAYSTALSKHGLTEFFSNTIYIQTPFLKRAKTVFGVPYRFVKVAPFKRLGIYREGTGNHSFWMTDVEKTIVDCFDLVDYSPGYEDLIRAFKQAELDGDRLIRYCNSLGSIAVTKRLGFLSAFFEKDSLSGFVKFARTQVNGKYSLLDPKSNESGEFVSEWKLRLNINRQELLGIANRQY